ncbi:hypothetical protein CVD19_24040 [Bacillus sp. T33-2]|nr:hypothetical protein CVD19_24040 [Bacillus sp. T33-2]
MIIEKANAFKKFLMMVAMFLSAAVVIAIPTIIISFHIFPVVLIPVVVMMLFTVFAHILTPFPFSI